MQKISYLLIGLLIGSVVTYIVTKYSLTNEQELEEESALWNDDKRVPVNLAAKRFAKYVERADKMYNGTINTRYLNLPFKDLNALIRKYKREKGATGIRIYPMIYTSKTNSGSNEERYKLFNILIIPIKSSDGRWNDNSKIIELFDTSGREKSSIFPLSGIENQIGQCPPPKNSNCINEGSLLLNYSLQNYGTWPEITD